MGKGGKGKKSPHNSNGSYYSKDNYASNHGSYNDNAYPESYNSKSTDNYHSKASDNYHSKSTDNYHSKSEKSYNNADNYHSKSEKSYNNYGYKGGKSSKSKVHLFFSVSRWQ